MTNNLVNKTIALAGILQAISLIREMAESGRMDEVAFQGSIYSIFQTQPENTLDVFGSLTNIRYGLLRVINPSKPIAKFSQIYLKHLFALIRLQNKMRRHPKLIQVIGQRIQQIQKQVNYFSLTHPTVIANLAEIYVLCVGEIHFRFFIVGNKNILNISENMEKIRALLLASIRATILWSQLGGTRLELIFAWGKFKKTAVSLINETNQLNGAHL